jgi:hypothetical protein
MAEAACIDLRQFSPPYRCFNEPEDRAARSYDDPWGLIIPGWSGFLAPQGGEYLLACTRGRITTDRVLAAAEGAVITQDGGDGQNVKFHVRHLDVVAPILRLRRRRQVVLTEEQLQARRDLLARINTARHTQHPGEAAHEPVHPEGGVQPG